MSTVRAPRRAPVTRPRAEPRPEPRPARPDLRVVEPAPRRVGVAMVTTLAVVVVFVLLFALAGFHAWLVQNQQRLDHLHRDVTEAQNDYQRLRLQVDELESPEHVVDVAVNKLGMVPPPETTYLTPSAGVGDGAATATAADPDAGTAEAAADTTWAEVKPYLDPTP